MSKLVLLSTHRLPLAGALRNELQRGGLEVRLVPTPALAQTELLGRVRPALLILTGEEEGEAWVDLASEHGDLPTLAVLPGQGAMARGEALGFWETFPDHVDPADVAQAARQTIERRQLQKVTGMIGTSAPIRDVLGQMAQMAPVDSTVLITGESGTGKELVARGLHELSPRRGLPFLAVNVAALSETLLESELFGHERGAFTGATDTRKGFFELADRGTLFLDEIGEMPLSTQTQFLRVLEQREFLRVGGQRAISVDVRVVAATHRDLREAVAEGRFRRDLYYRLNILNLRLPPLRERPGDIPLLIRAFVREVVGRTGRPFAGITPEAMARLQAHPWPGNIRELRNLVESMVVLSPGHPITPSDLPQELGYPLLPGPRPLLPPVSAGSAPSAPVPDWRGNDVSDEGKDESREPPLSSGTSIRPELEFIFRTLVDLRVDMEELRSDFERYRSQLNRESPPRPLVGGKDGWEIGTRTPDTELPDAQEAYVVDSPTERALEPDSLHIPEDMTMEALEEAAIRAALERAQGNRRLAAERLGIGERTLYRKIQKFGLD